MDYSNGPLKWPEIEWSEIERSEIEWSEIERSYKIYFTKICHAKADNFKHFHWKCNQTLHNGGH